MGLADRMLVVYEGAVTGTLMQGEFNEEKILRLASGIVNSSDSAKT